MRRPGSSDRVFLAVGLGVVVGVLAWTVPPVGAVMAATVAWRARVERVAAIAILMCLPLGLAAAAWDVASAERMAARPFEEGPVSGVLTLASDPMSGRFGASALGDWSGTPVVAAGDGLMGLAAGDVLEVVGVASGSAGSYRGTPVRSRIAVRSVDRVGTLPWFVPANALRDRIRLAVAPHRGGAGALVSGFLIGDIDHLPELDRARLTAAGLSHFVAVSGSNVALFLALWWVVTMPLSIHPRLRWCTGLVGLALFVLITRWEPSVLRAASMAGLVLVGRTAGVPLSGWGSLGLAVAGLALVQPSIVLEVGFQLSAAATLGLLVGAGSLEEARPRWLMAPLAASVAAQVAVAPLLLAHFGSVPIVSPMANLVAAPLVVAATTTGGIGALTGFDPLVSVAVRCADGVLWVARFADGFPVLGWWGSGVAGLVAVMMASRTWRIVGASVGIVMALALVVPTGAIAPSLVMLDVGQGDAILLTGPAGARILVDGGPDPRRLAELLRAHRVDELDLVVISHRHSAHVRGLDAVWGQMVVGEVWFVPDVELTPVLDRVASLGIPVRSPLPGERYRVGGIDLEVKGPLRRYASPNDGSLVLVAVVEGVRIGLVGDIETWAQSDLGPLDVDVLKVPHQGAATSDPEWLARSAGSIALVSVGPNDFGHPATWVLETLSGAGAVVCRTDLDGDLVVRLERPLAAPCRG